MAKKKLKNAKDAYICPKCGSLRLEITHKMPSPTDFITSVPPQNFLCRDCTYEGIVPKIDKDKIEKFRNDLKKYKKLT